jgi:DNA-directed RNA polymerase subunit RPC12/RpoP
MHQPPAPRLSYAGPTICLRCDQTFRSWDRRHNRLCPRCRNVLKTQPSDETSYRAPTRRRLAPDDSPAAR